MELAWLLQFLPLQCVWGLQIILTLIFGFAIGFERKMRFKEAGIRTVMITGDHPETAKAIAVEAGFPSPSVLTQKELMAMPEKQRKEAILKYNIIMIHCTVQNSNPSAVYNALACSLVAGRYIQRFSDGFP